MNKQLIDLMSMPLKNGTWSLNQVRDVQGLIAEAERERIIELLQAGRHESHAIDDIFDGVVGMGISRADFKQGLIALIKGENK